MFIKHGASNGRVGSRTDGKWKTRRILGSGAYICTNENYRLMKIKPALFVPLAMLLLISTAWSQQYPGLPAHGSSTVLVPSKPGEPLTRFDLDFPGGTPRELVAAIQKAMGRPLNAIVSDEHAKVKLPALNMKNVNVAELFEALEMASRRQEIIFGNYPGNPYTTVSTFYGFKKGNAPVT